MKQIVMLPRFIVALLTASLIIHADENGATIKLFNGCLLYTSDAADE